MPIPATEGEKVKRDEPGPGVARRPDTPQVVVATNTAR
jgi:hypothetical protein